MKPKTKYEAVNLKQVEKLAGLGLTMEELAYCLGVNRTTIYYWREKPEFSEALDKGKAIADSKVVGSLYRRALGYKYTEVHTEEIIIMVDGKRAPGKKIKKIRKEVVPDVVAQIFWLKNRQPDKWRDRQEIDHTLKAYKHSEFKGKTPDELVKEANELAQTIIANRGRTPVPEEN